MCVAKKRFRVREKASASAGALFGRECDNQAGNFDRIRFIFLLAFGEFPPLSRRKSSSPAHELAAGLSFYRFIVTKVRAAVRPASGLRVRAVLPPFALLQSDNRDGGPPSETTPFSWLTTTTTRFRLGSCALLIALASPRYGAEQERRDVSKASSRRGRLTALRRSRSGMQQPPSACHFCAEQNANQA